MENFFQLVFQCLTESELDKKLLLSEETVKKLNLGDVEIKPCPLAIENIQPGRPDKPKLIKPKDLARRNTHTEEGKAAMVHSFAHIEFNAINLAWDLICRFQDMPIEFYKDWTQVAAEETKHFKMLRRYLNDIGYDYGSFPAHAGLWEIAEQTKHDILLRLAVVPRILEARGLDVTPDLIERFKQVKDQQMIEILELILEEEIGHVLFGTKWYRFICKRLNKDPDSVFNDISNEYLPSSKTKKVNEDARLKAGFSHVEIDYLLQS